MAEEMFDLRVLELARDRMRSDPQLLSVLGENFEIWLVFGERKPKFPYVVHGLHVKGNNDAVVQANYYCDIWDFGLDRSRIMAAVRRIRKLMEAFVDHTGGGIRFFWRDTIYSTEKEKLQKAQILFHVRGVDKDQCTPFIG